MRLDSPLADLLRPKTINEVVGQEDLFGEGKPLFRMISSGKISSMILWGPPGCGKTSIARLLNQTFGGVFVSISAIFSGVSELKKIFEEAKQRKENHEKTLLFVDEIHRFNKTQQDSFLPVLEDGTIYLIGATTENPSFELNKALLSRCQVFLLKGLDDSALDALFNKAEEALGISINLTVDAQMQLKHMCGGDGRAYLNMLELIVSTLPDQEIDALLLNEILQRRSPMYDKSGDQHYNLISVLHKSMRGSDVNASIYWLTRMLDGGEDPLYILRRLIRFATEDVGISDPQALGITLDAHRAYEVLGSPEGDLALYQAVVYLATSPKSNSLYVAQKKAAELSPKTAYLNPPSYALNAPTKLMKEQGMGKGYVYDHDLPSGFSGLNYFPEGMNRIELYHPVQRGFEREIIKRLEYWDKLRQEK